MNLQDLNKLLFETDRYVGILLLVLIRKSDRYNIKTQQTAEPTYVVLFVNSFKRQIPLSGCKTNTLDPTKLMSFSFIKVVQILFRN